MAHQKSITIKTSGAGLTEFTTAARAFVGNLPAAATQCAMLTVFVRHTSCSLIIQENADPDVRVDLHNYMEKLVPHANDPAMHYLIHRMEGPDDMPAHIKAALTNVSLNVPVADGDLLLGTWQGIYLWEHRARPHRREIVFHLS